MTPPNASPPGRLGIITAKVVMGLALLTVLHAGMATYAITSMKKASSLARELYDRPFMAVDFSRSAWEDFLDMNQIATLLAHEEDPAARAKLLASFADKRQALADDFAVVKDRSVSETATTMVPKLVAAIDAWSKAATAGPAAQPAEQAGWQKGTAEIREQFDILVESAKEAGLAFRESATATSAAAQWFILAGGAVDISAGIAVAIFFYAWVAIPVARMTQAMVRLAANDVEVPIPALARRDELGRMASAVKVFKDAMIEGAHRKTLDAERERLEEQRKRYELNQIAEQFETSVKGVVATVAAASAQMRDTARSVSATAESAAGETYAVAEASGKALDSVQNVSTASSELSISVTEIGQQVLQSTRMSTNAVSEAARTQRSVIGMAEAAQRIGAVLTLINDIAAQTNLLALNATIEAARAGQAGRGFAVVAAEVKSLAAQTATATGEIAEQIASVRAATEETVQAIRSISQTITQVNEIATKIAAAVERQTASTQEIAGSAQKAADETAAVTSRIGVVSRSVVDTGKAANDMLSAAGTLVGQAETLQVQVDRFLSSVRAA